MEPPSPKPARPPVFFALLIAVLSLGAIWVAATFFLANTQQALADSIHLEPLPLRADAVFGASQSILAGTWTGLTLTTLLALGALLPQISIRFRQCSAWALHGLALLLVAGVLYLGLLGYAGLRWVNEGRSRQLNGYRNNLEVFALVTAAEHRADRTEELLHSILDQHFHLASSEEEYTFSQRRRHLILLTRALERTQDPQAQRRILATLMYYRRALEETPEHDLILLQRAQELSGQTFADIPALLKWLPLAQVEDGWEPLPMFVIE